jgi:hypothetical protein
MDGSVACGPHFEKFFTNCGNDVRCSAYPRLSWCLIEFAESAGLVGKTISVSFDLGISDAIRACWFVN